MHMCILKAPDSIKAAPLPPESQNSIHPSSFHLLIDSVWDALSEMLVSWHHFETSFMFRILVGEGGHEKRVWHTLVTQTQPEGHQRTWRKKVECAATILASA